VRETRAASPPPSRRLPPLRPRPFPHHRIFAARSEQDKINWFNIKKRSPACAIQKEKLARNTFKKSALCFKGKLKEIDSYFHWHLAYLLPSVQVMSHFEFSNGPPVVYPE
jgi:hypothetical protein